jgi:hypothetical protein
VWRWVNLGHDASRGAVAVVPSAVVTIHGQRVRAVRA